MSDSAEPRVKRQKVDKHGRFAALAKLKELKGNKHKYEVGDKVDNVYDEVDEKEYAKMITSRAAADWIEDDGTGYVEDGREIFDDEEYSEEVHNSKAAKKSSKKAKENKTPAASSSKSLSKMFSNIAAKRKEASTAKLKDDDVLADILDEVKEMNSHTVGTSASRGAGKSSTKAMEQDEAVSVDEYMKSFKENIKAKVPVKSTDDDDLLERVFKSEKKLQTVKNERDPIRESHIVINPAAVVKIPPIEIKSEIKEINEPSTSPKKSMKRKSFHIDGDNDDDDEFTGMDFSILDDAENQIAVATPTVKSENLSVVKTPPKVVDIEEENRLLNGWNKVCSVANTTVVEDSTTDPADQIIYDDKSEMKIWYWDAWEDPVMCPGQVFLFGKVATNTKSSEYQSVCVNIRNIDRCLYLLPREYIFDLRSKTTTEQAVTLRDVFDEFNDKIAGDLGIPEFRSRVISKRFPFSVAGVDVPETCEYLEVRYAGKFATPNNKAKYSSIGYIFGTNTTALETFVLESKLQGPSWLDVKNFTVNAAPKSWCKVELICPDRRSIEVSPERNTGPVPLTVFTVNVRTALNPKTQKNEIVMIGCMVNSKFALDKPPKNPPFERHMCGISRPITQSWPPNIQPCLAQYTGTKVMRQESERALLSWFITMYNKYDPDLILTHDANDCQLDAICDRLATLKIEFRSRLGKLKISNPRSVKLRDSFIGRMICDIKLSAEELIKSKSFDLGTLCQNVLNVQDGERMDVSNADLTLMYETADGILKLIALTMQDCLFTMRLMCEMNVLPLAAQLTTICGNLMGRTLQGGRSERNEFLLLHAFTETNCIVPDKRGRENLYQNSNDASTTDTAAPKKKVGYSGGLVLDPIKGFYDQFILLMDFNSLYPSIIQEYNICFTTVLEPENDTDIAEVPHFSVEQGILPRQIRRLVESRRDVKRLMANANCTPDQKVQYNIRQMALKLTANSMYGCLGFGHSRFYAQHLAALVTHKGREILIKTKTLVESLNYVVIYGDTDSIMINTNVTDYNKVFQIGKNIKHVVNKQYRQVELEIDGVFKRLLMLKKKKYAALTIEKDPKKPGAFIEKQELKGLDIVRRDWSPIAVMAGYQVVGELLSENTMDGKIDNIRMNLEKIGNKLRDGTTPLKMLIITKQLTKAPKDYTNLMSTPHVAVALRMNATRNMRFKKGDVVGYIIALDGTDNAATKRAYHVDEMKSREDLQVDIEYYLVHQVHAVVTRLLEVIEETDSFRIAEMLGIDPTRYKNMQNRPRADIIEEFSVGDSIIASNPYEACVPFRFKCAKCKTENEMKAPFRRSERGPQVAALGQCVNSECGVAPFRYSAAIRNAFMLAARTAIKRFYENWLVCDNPACNNNTRIFTKVMHNGRPRCIACKDGVLYRQYTPGELNTQLCFYRYIFDLSKCDDKLTSKLPKDVVATYNSLKQLVDSYLKQSQYCIINLKDFFTIPNTKSY